MSRSVCERARLARVVACAAVAVMLWSAPARADQVDVLIRQLTKSNDYKERLSAALNLSKIGDPRAIPAFIQALDDDDKTVRGVAAASLGKLIDRKTPPALRRQAMDKLKTVAAKDPNQFVRKQAQKAYDTIKNLGDDGPPQAARIYVNIGPMSDGTSSGKQLMGKMRDTVVGTFSRQARGMATEWPGGKPPTKKEIAKAGASAFYVDGTLTELSVSKQGSSAVVTCKVSMLIATWPDKSMFGFLKGGASVQSGTSERDVGLAKEDCVVAVVEDLTKRKIIPTIQQRAP